MALNVTNALVAISVSGGAASPQPAGAVLQVATGVPLIFSLQSTSLIQVWEITLISDNASLNGQVFSWHAGQANQLSIPTPAAPYNLTYQSLVSDGASSTAYIQGKVTSVGASAVAVATTANFTQPSALSTVSVSVGTTAGMAANQYLFISGGGTYQIASVTNASQVVVTNLALAGNASPGAVISAGAIVGASGPVGANGATGAAGSGPIGSVGITGTTGTLSSAGDTVAYNVSCATSNKTYRFRATCVIRCPSSTGGGGSPQTGNSWTRSIWVIAENSSGTVRIVAFWYDGDPEGDPVMATGGIGGGCAITVGGVSGTNVQLIATGNGNNGATNLSVTWSGADQWGGT